MGLAACFDLLAMAGSPGAACRTTSLGGAPGPCRAPIPASAIAAAASASASTSTSRAAAGTAPGPPPWGSSVPADAWASLRQAQADAGLTQMAAAGASSQGVADGIGGSALGLVVAFTRADTASAMAQAQRLGQALASDPGLLQLLPNTSALVRGPLPLLSNSEFGICIARYVAPLLS